MGKGSAPRKFSVDHTTFSNNWDAIFGKKHGNKPSESNQLHGGERTIVCTGEGQSGVHRELPAHREGPANERGDGHPR